MNVEVISPASVRSRLIPLLLALWTCCASGTHKWNPDEVLADILTRGYRYSGDQRKTAIEDIALRDGAKSAAVLRQVAEMRRSLEPTRELADLLVIEAALTALTEMRDVEAVELNRRRLDDDSIRGIALTNLKELKAWDATADVEAWFATTPLRRDGMHDLSKAAMFLSSSPRSTGASCTAIERIRRSFPECSGSTTDYRCMELDGSLIDLSRHLRCSAESRTANRLQLHDATG
jgi:hypothetical protein